MPLKHLRHCLIALFTLSLTACISLKLPNKGSTTFQKITATKRITQLQHLKNWNIRGAFSIQYNKKAELANYSWQQHNTHYLINISSALNLYTVTIAGKPGSVSLQESKQQSLSASSPEALLHKRLGWSIPVSSLNYWVRGLANPSGIRSRHYDKYGHLIALSQQGWQVNFQHYLHVKQYDLPQLLSVKGHGIKLKLVIKNWSI